MVVDTALLNDKNCRVEYS